MTGTFGALRHWVVSSITVKFAIAGGLLLALIMGIAATGYFSLSYVRMAEGHIQISTKIQRLVLEMDRGMEEARRLHGDFFQHYTALGLSEAHETYAQPAVQLVSQVIETGERLSHMIEQSPVSEKLKQKRMDLKLFFSSARRFADTSIRSYELVTKRVADQRGIEPRLDQALGALYKHIESYEGLRRDFREMKTHVMEYKLDRHRFHMQSVFNAAQRLKDNVTLIPFFSDAEKKQVYEHLEHCESIENELLDVDREIKSIFRDFTLQDNAVDTVSESLVMLAREDVSLTRKKINRAFRTTVGMMLVMTFLGLCLGLITAYTLHNGVTKKLVALTKTAEQIRQGNLEISIPQDSSDELGQLAGTFNVMTARMRDLVYHLEDVVSKRTFELKESNKKLQQEIHERTKAEEEKERLESELRQAHKMEAIGTLAGGIAHDFNNILSAILGYTEMAKDDLPPDSHVVQTLEEVMIAGLRAKDIIQQILAFSRKSQQGKTLVSLNDLLEEAVRLIRISIPSTVSIHKDIQAKAKIYADPTQIHQVLINLCTNAAQAMDANGGALTVRIRIMGRDEDSAVLEKGMVQEDYVALEVCDEGEGIDPSIIEKIFDPYFTTKDVGRGSGMGLSVVHGIVKNHGGTIHVKSDIYQGATFTVYLPVAFGTVSHEEKQPLPAPVENGESILVVDDEPAMADINRKRLEAFGYKVITMTQSLQALDYFKASSHDVDLVITDQTMPQMTGVQLAKEMLSIKPDIPIIISTGYSSKIDEDMVLNMGIKAYLMKPINRLQLAKVVRETLDDSGDGTNCV